MKNNRRHLCSEGLDVAKCLLHVHMYFSAEGNNSPVSVKLLAEVLIHRSVFRLFIAKGSLFTEFWKRKQARCAMRWGMTGFEQQEQTRPQYQGIRYDTGQKVTICTDGIGKHAAPRTVASASTSLYRNAVKGMSVLLSDPYLLGCSK